MFAAALRQILTAMEVPGMILPLAGSTLTHGSIEVAVQARMLEPVLPSKQFPHDGICTRPL
jgi:hypothetical protein